MKNIRLLILLQMIYKVHHIVHLCHEKVTREYFLIKLDTYMINDHYKYINHSAWLVLRYKAAFSAGYRYTCKPICNGVVFINIS